MTIPSGEPMPRTLAVAVALAVLAAACAVQPTPEPTPRQGADLAGMNGYWIGEYVSAETGKTGAITLTIRSSPDSAIGDIVLAPHGSSPFVAADIATHQKHAASPEVLRIAFRPVRGGIVEGLVEDYFSTDCSCFVTTVLQATPSKDRMAGEYVTSNPAGLRQQGKWSVERHIVAANEVDR
jgi:hypothetical protein